jgi:hypothetical protein
VSEGDADADNCVGVVPVDDLQGAVPLGGAMGGTACGVRLVFETGGRRPSDEDGVHCFEQSSLAERTKDPAEFLGRKELLAGLEKKHTAPEDAGFGGKTSGRQDPLDYLDAAAPGRSSDCPAWAGPRPWLGRLPVAVLGQRSGVLPLLADVLGLAGVRDPQPLAGEQRGA